MPENAPSTVSDRAAPPAARAAPFVHLHLHSEYSLLDGGNRLDRLVARVKELGMPAVAVTDHGNLFGAVEFYEKAIAAGIKPILGVEAYVAPGDRRDRTHTGVGDGGYHLVLLAENDEGWRNLMYLCSEAYLTGFYYKPRMDRALLEEHGAGLIAINGHLGSEIGEHLLEYERSRDGKWWDRAVESALWHRRVFSGDPPRFYVELQHHVREQNAINPHLIRLAREVSVPLVATNDAHFLRAEDHDAHDTLICISMQRPKREPERLRYPPELYVKSPAEMRAVFEAYAEAGREACDNAAAIAERCNVSLPLGVSHAPMVRVTVPAPGELPKPEAPEFAGDLSAWYAAYCARFEVRPFSADGPDAARELALAKAECDAALRLLAEGGFVWRYGTPGGAEGGSGSAAGDDRAELRARLERELTILADKGISAYFLIVWDFVNWGRQRGVPALARGSGVGTMVGYVLGLSNACPVRYGLLFERFTDPDRSEYPDIDIDLCQDGRAAVIDYVRRKYGHVAQIITFGTLKARAAVRDCARVLEMPLGDADRLAKLIPEQLGITIEEALRLEPDFRSAYERDALARRVIDSAMAIEGQARHASVHAAGVIVATRPLHGLVPLCRPSSEKSGKDAPGADDVMTQWDGPACEKMGLLKMDFLGLRTLSVVERCKRLIREGLGEEEIWAAVGRSAEFEQDGRARGTPGEPEPGGPRPSPPSPRPAAAPRGHPLDLDRLSPDDPRVFELFQRGETTGVFQFESGGMRRLLVEMRPDRIEDLIAANALFRPGPMDLIPDYTRRKHGQDRVPQVHPIVDRHTAETYGVMVYQEQVMQIVHELGGIPLRAAYSLIKAISKKKEKEIAKQRPVFIQGAERQGLSRAKADELFETILKFAGYGFNKSHSTGYAIVAYQTAYLKTYFPNQYLAAFLTYESAASKVADWIPYLEDCKRTRFINGKVGVEVRPPDVNLSQSEFAVVFDGDEPRDALHGHVRFGLSAIKGVGDKAIAAILEERDSGAAGARRPFTSLFDFCERVIARSGAAPGLAGAGGAGAAPRSGGAVLTKATLEALIKCGSMDGLHGRATRAAMLASIEPALAAAQKAALDRAAGQGALFGLGGPVGASGAASPPGAPLASVRAWTEPETLAAEKEVLGFYVSSHPLEQWGPWIRAFAAVPLNEVKQREARSRVLAAGVVQSVRTLIVRAGASAGQKMGAAVIEDRTGSLECVAFSDVYALYGHLLEPDAMVFVIGELDLTRAQPQVKVERVLPIDAAPRTPIRWMDVLFTEQPGPSAPPGAPACEEVMERAAAELSALIAAQQAEARSIGSGGAAPPAPFAPVRAGALGAEAAGAAPPLRPVPLRVFVALAGRDRPVPIPADPRWAIVPSPEAVRRLECVLGEGCLRLSGPLPAREEQDRRPYRNGRVPIRGSVGAGRPG